ncbi:MAG: rhodanese-like domain-containing protein [Aggregatilineales bacterium]
MNILKSIFGGGDSSSLTVDEVHDKMSNNPALFLLDVRQSNEFKSGHIKGAKLIPLDKLQEKMNKLPRDKQIICVCRSGARSGMARRQLKAAGFDVVNMKGGMMAWQHAGHPVKKG